MIFLYNNEYEKLKTTFQNRFYLSLTLRLTLCAFMVNYDDYHDKLTQPGEVSDFTDIKCKITLKL
jgi:hypothetical protein